MNASRFDGRTRRLPPQRNEALRAHVTRVGFDLTLGRSHVAALVYLNESLERHTHIRDKDIAAGNRRLFALFASAIGGCITRGLVVHHYDETAPKDGRAGLNPHYSFTRAGELVIDLLRESGLYDEYAGALPVADREVS